MSSTVYSEENMQTLSDVQAIRVRPAMYIGCIGERVIHHLVGELLANAMHEVLSGFGTHVGLTLFANGSCSVLDDGRGIAGDIVPALTTIGYSTKDGYRFGWAQPGIGLKAVTALSEAGQLDTFHNGEHHRIEFARGVVTSGPSHVGSSNGRTGTIVRFKPDPEIFGDHTFDLRAILHTLCELVFLHSGVRFTFTDERTGCTDTFQFADGLTTFVKLLNTGKETLHEPIRISGKEAGIKVEVAFQFQNDVTQERGYANSRFARDGGTHIHGFRRGLGRAIREFAEQHKCWRLGLKVIAEDIRVGVTVVVSIEHPAPQWEYSTATRLGNSDAEKVVARIVHAGLKQHLESEPEIGKKLCKQIELAARVREAVRKACGGQRVGQPTAG